MRDYDRLVGEVDTLRAEVARLTAQLADLECDEMLTRVAADRMALREEVERLTRENERLSYRHFVCEAHVPTEPMDEEVCPCCEATRGRQGC